jgi:diguanylate cyclase (GGDEF)-like protein/PAS domain S-box-containing protein
MPLAAPEAEDAASWASPGRDACLDRPLSSTERAEATLEAIRDAVVTTDADWRVTYLNPAAENICGWAAQDAAGRGVAEVCNIVDAESRQAVGQRLVAAILERTADRAALPSLLQRRDGGEIEVDVTASALVTEGRIAGAVIVLREVGVARQVSRQLTRMAFHDPLTELANRALLSDRLQVAIALAERNQHNVAVLFIDIDRFKDLNDSMGHGVGDILLASVARRLAGCVRSSDTVSRYGGDEFVVLLNQVNQPEYVALTAEKLRHAVATPHYVSGRTLHTTVSIGVATYPEDGLDAAALLQNADTAMYHAKATGRNNHKAYSARPLTTRTERLALNDGVQLHGLRLAPAADDGTPPCYAAASG